MGYRLFVLCLRQVLVSWPVAARISVFWFPVIFFPGLILGFLSGTPEAGEVDVDAAVNRLLVLLVLIPLSLFGSTIMAIAWHRYVLREELPYTIFVYRSDWKIGRYIINIFKIGGLCILLALPLFMIALGIFGTNAIALMFPIAMAIIWLFLRLGLVLPAIALGDPLTLRESFALTAPLAGSLVLTSFLFTLFQVVPDIVNLLLTQATGDGSSSAGKVLFFTIWSLVFAWLNLFVGSGVLTVLYGYLREGRPV